MECYTFNDAMYFIVLVHTKCNYSIRICKRKYWFTLGHRYLYDFINNRSWYVKIIFYYLYPMIGSILKFHSNLLYYFLFFSIPTQSTTEMKKVFLFLHSLWCSWRIGRDRCHFVLFIEGLYDKQWESWHTTMKMKYINLW